MEHVTGIDRGRVILYALSTCAWCKRTKRLLEKLGVDHYIIDVDLLDGEEKTRIDIEVERWNPRRSFPTIVIDDSDAILGYDDGEIRKRLGG